jgi:Mn-dependent DtxR family transcriptional regulator
VETVIQTLEKMGRASYREVAARLDIEPVEALNMLREQRDQGLCDFADGGWFICTATEQAKNQQHLCIRHPV